MTWQEAFPNPDEVGASEYRAIHDDIIACMLSQPEKMTEIEEIQMVYAMLEEFKGHAEALMKKIYPLLPPGADKCACSECNTLVTRSDPYFATPCGTFCSSCMESKHAKECGICKSEFDLDPEPEQSEHDDSTSGE